MPKIKSDLHFGSHLYAEGRFLRCLSRIERSGGDATVVLQHTPLDARRSGKVLFVSLSDLIRLEQAGLAALIRVGPSSPAPVVLPNGHPTDGTSGASVLAD